MMRVVCALFTSGWLVLAAAAAPGAELTAKQVAARIQEFYERTRDFQAAFQQEYTSKALGRTRRSAGFVYIKKPGKMRWDYRSPKRKHFVCDGETLYMYQPELDQVVVDRGFSGSQLSTAVTFLWGRGRLADEFAISFAERGDLGGPKQYVLKLVPNKKARFRKVFFVVDRDSFRVEETVVVDPGGNVNHIFFANVSTNVGLKDEAFAFEVPEGVEVIEAPGR